MLRVRLVAVIEGAGASERGGGSRRGLLAAGALHGAWSEAAVLRLPSISALPAPALLTLPGNKPFQLRSKSASSRCI